MKQKNLFLLAAMAVLLVSCGGKGNMKFGDNEYPVASVASSSSSTQSTYPAVIKGIQDVEIRPKVAGFITRVNVKEGQSVSAGQVLFVIDNTTYQASVRQAQAALNSASSQMKTAKLTYENSQQLFNSSVIGQYELQSAQNTYETAKAAVAQAQAGLASAKEMLSFCYVKSPSAGVVGSLPFKVGTLVSASSMQPLTTVSNISKMEVYFSMTERDMLGMTKTSGDVAAVIAQMPTVKLQLADGTIYNQPGKVVKASGVIDASTGSVSMIAHFNNPDRLLKSGGSGSIVVPHVSNSAIVIPQTATVSIQNKLFVYIVGKDNKVKYTEIKVAPQNDGKTYVVTDGVKVGDRIVTKGITSLTDGMEIKPITEEQYQKKLDEAAKLGAAQGDLDEFKKAMGGE